MKKKKKLSKVKRLIRLRHGLMLLAALLFLLTLFSGYMAFFHDGDDPQPLPPPTETIQETILPEETTTAPTEETEETTEGTEPPDLPNSQEASESEATDPTIPEKVDTVASYAHNSGAASGSSAVFLMGKSPLLINLTDITLPTDCTEPGNFEVPSHAQNEFPWHIVFFILLSLLVLDLLAVLLLDRRILSMRKNNTTHELDPIPHTALNFPLASQTAQPEPNTPRLSIGTLHQPGRRQYQQDSLGHTLVLDGKGILAVLADGMGGLQDGDKVSQKIILRSLELGTALRSNQVNGALYRILNQVNEDVNRMLTPSGLYKCGSTMVAVLVQDMTFQWVSVGDSRIYLYREGYMNRINRDHDLFQDWMPEILNGTRLMEDCLADANGRKLTSFIGMGNLKYVDGSISPIDVLPGDRIVLMSDGVYGEVPEEEMAAIFKQYPDVNQAATALDHRIRANQNPHQDNYTALILGF